jgi:predicted RNA binding protein YcfA (HicA-like mRNA interferase family)
MRTVSGKDFCKILERHGWSLARISGSHHIYTQPEKPVILSVPVHGNQSLKSGTQRALMRHAGLTEGDL